MTAPLSDDEIQDLLAEVLLSDWFDGYGAADAAAALLPAVRDIAAREARAKVQRVEELIPRIEGVIEFDMAGERYDAVMSVQQVLEHLRRAIEGKP
jgi:hypothetical protein